MMLASALRFAQAGAAYWLELFPVARRERRLWEARAAVIPDAALRHDAQFSLRTKWGHAEGAAAFATLAPRASRRRVARMAIAYQVLVDYLDTTSERRVANPFANTFRLHQVLFAALGQEPGEEGEHYEHHPHREDGGFLATQAGACREIFSSLPSAAVVAPAAHRFAALYAEAQGICHAMEAGLQESAIAPRTEAEVEGHADLQYGEMLAAGSSSLPVLVLLALAAKPGLSTHEVERVSEAYYPWISSLHILLHGVVDRDSDRASGQFNQLNHYLSTAEAAERLGSIASRARDGASHLQSGGLHEIILAGMGGYYLAPDQVRTPENAEISRRALEALGPLAMVALRVHRLRRSHPRREATPPRSEAGLESEA